MRHDADDIVKLEMAAVGEVVWQPLTQLASA